jgi:hypothetical protein
MNGHALPSLPGLGYPTGAGLDTFAYRNPSRQLRVFEVNIPATEE